MFAEKAEIFLYVDVISARERTMHLTVPGFDIKHHAVADFHQRGICSQINNAVAVHQTGKALFLRHCKQLCQKVGAQGTFAAGGRDAAYKRNVFAHLVHHLPRRHGFDARRSQMRTGNDARVAFHTFIRIPYDAAIRHGKRSFRAARDACAAVAAHILRLGIVAVGAGDVARLKENRGAAARSIDRAEGDDAVDRRC